MSAPDGGAQAHSAPVAAANQGDGCKRPFAAAKWSLINRISETGVLSAGYYGAVFIPVGAAAMMQLNAVLGTNFTFGVNIFIAYVASLTLALGKLAYSVYCPKIIQYYNNFNRYLSELDDLTRSVIALSTVRLPIALEEIERQVTANAGTRKLTDAETKLAVERVKELRRQLAEADVKSDLADIVINYEGRWGEAERKRPRWRMAITLLYLTSAVSAGYLLIVVGLFRMAKIALFPA